jgi:hypothetical protein
MKRPKKKTEEEDAATYSSEVKDESPVREHTDTPIGNPTGIDAIQALQFAGIAICLLLLIWYVLHFVLHIL